mgnify:FL=1
MFRTHDPMCDIHPVSPGPDDPATESSGAGLTKAQAVEFSSVSREHLVMLMQTGAVSPYFTEDGLRLRQTDFVAYRERRHQESREALRALADLSQELTLGTDGASGLLVLDASALPPVHLRDLLRRPRLEGLSAERRSPRAWRSLPARHPAVGRRAFACGFGTWSTGGDRPVLVQIGAAIGNP